MIRRFCTLEDRHATTMNLTRGGLRILTALALAFVLGGADPSGSAQAAPAYSPYPFNMVVVPSALYVCENESMTFKVSIEVQLQNQPGDTSGRFRRVQGSMVNAELVAGGKSITPSQSFIGNPGSLDPYSVTFTFKAGNAAQITHLRFSAEISTFWYNNSPVLENGRTQSITKAVDIEIRKCSYKVEMLFQEPMPGMGLITGMAHEVRLNRVSDTHFSGDTIFYLTVNIRPGLGCPLTAEVLPVRLDYSADLAGDRLYLNVHFASFKGTVTMTSCGDLPTTQTLPIDTPPGSATVSVPSAGGLGVLSTPYWTYLFIVTRVNE